MTIHSKTKKEEEPREHISCAHDGCHEPAITRQKLKHGWAFLCKAHDLFHNQVEADEFCRSNGLTTRAAQIAFIREKLASKPTAVEHWQRVMQSHGLQPIVYQMAREYLDRKGIQREPGEEG